MTDEVLNLEYHYRRMAVKALNKTRNYKEAAVLLGISDRTLYHWKKNFGIYYNKSRNEFLLNENKMMIVK